MPKRITFFIPDEYYNQLRELAEKEFRSPNAQAAFIVCQELRTRGLLRPMENLAQLVHGEK